MNFLTYDFNESAVRVVMREGQPWFVLADLCRVLEHTNPSMACEGLDEDERMTLNITEGHSGQRGGARMIGIVSESGLYALVFKSRKPEAKTFRKWVTSEVLPALRKTGKFEVPQTPGIEDRVSLLQFVRETCNGWSLGRQMEFGLHARRWCKAMGVMFEVETLPNLGRVFTFPRQVLNEVRLAYAQTSLAEDSDASEFEKLLECVWLHDGDASYEPEMLRGVAKTMKMFPRIFGVNTSLESERSGFGRLCERFNGRRFPSGYTLSVRGAGLRRRYQIRNDAPDGAMRHHLPADQDLASLAS